MSHEIVRTKAGVCAVRSIEAGEVMHPGVGPRAEAEHLYVRQSRLEERLSNHDDDHDDHDDDDHDHGDSGPDARAAGGGGGGGDVSAAMVVFDVGLGAGSNAIAAWGTSERAPPGVRRLELVSFERDLGALELALAHGDDFALTGAGAVAVRQLIANGRSETARTIWRLERGDVLDRLAQERARAAIVFWDPFSARVNPALWTIAAFRAVRACAGPRCTLFTYSASTAVRIALLLAGWAVGAGDGIGDRAETTAAAVRLDDVARPLDRRWLRRLERADVPLPSDAPSRRGGDIAGLIGALPQFSGATDRGHNVSR